MSDLDAQHAQAAQTLTDNLDALAAAVPDDVRILLDQMRTSRSPRRGFRQDGRFRAATRRSLQRESERWLKILLPLLRIEAPEGLVRAFNALRAFPVEARTADDVAYGLQRLFREWSVKTDAGHAFAEIAANMLRGDLPELIDEDDDEGDEGDDLEEPTAEEQELYVTELFAEAIPVLREANEQIDARGWARVLAEIASHLDDEPAALLQQAQAAARRVH